MNVWTKTYAQIKMKRYEINSVIVRLNEAIRVSRGRSHLIEEQWTE